jgi:gas vesicle protein
MNKKKTTGVTSENTPQDLGGSMAYEYDRVEREDGGGSFLMGLLAGTVLGAGLGMLFAPKAGSEVRKQLSEQATRLRSTASDTLNQASEKFNQASAQATEKIGQASDKVSQMVDRGRDVVDRGRDAYERAKAPIA